MQINITGRHFEVTEAMKAYINEKLSRLNRYFDHIIEAHTVLSIEKYRHKAEVTLLVKRVSIFTSEKSNDMYTSIDKVMDKMERKLRRYKTKLKGHSQKHFNNIKEMKGEATI